MLVPEEIQPPSPSPPPHPQAPTPSRSRPQDEPHPILLGVTVVFFTSFAVMALHYLLLVSALRLAADGTRFVIPEGLMAEWLMALLFALLGTTGFVLSYLAVSPLQLGLKLPRRGSWLVFHAATGSVFTYLALLASVFIVPLWGILPRELGSAVFVIHFFTITVLAFTAFTLTHAWLCRWFRKQKTIEHQS